jgi:hypothetical protein
MRRSSSDNESSGARPIRHEFVENQARVGMRIIGRFRDLDDPNRFVGLRGFDTMATRGPLLVQEASCGAKICGVSD